MGKQAELSKVDCNEIANKAITSLSESIKKTETKIHVGKLPFVYGYSAELTELCKHLITNSIEFRRKDLAPEIRITAKQIDNN